VEIVVKDTTDSPNSVSYLDHHLKHDINGTLITKLYDKCDYVNFPIVNYPFLDNDWINRFNVVPVSTVTPRHLLHMLFTCQSWFDIREL